MSNAPTTTATKARRGYTIRTKQAVLATVPTYGAALAWAKAHTDVKNAAILWGDKGSRMNFREWALIAEHAVARLRARGLSADALLANDGTR